MPTPLPLVGDMLGAMIKNPTLFLIVARTSASDL
jgi:hypothetical protein